MVTTAAAATDEEASQHQRLLDEAEQRLQAMHREMLEKEKAYQASKWVPPPPTRGPPSKQEINQASEAATKHLPRPTQPNASPSKSQSVPAKLQAVICAQALAQAVDQLQAKNNVLHAVNAELQQQLQEEKQQHTQQLEQWQAEHTTAMLARDVVLSTRAEEVDRLETELAEIECRAQSAEMAAAKLEQEVNELRTEVDCARYLDAKASDAFEAELQAARQALSDRGYTISPSPSCTCPHSSYSPSPYPASNLHPPCSPIRHTHHTHPPYHTTHTHTHAPHHQQQQHTCTQQLHTTTASQQQQHNYSNCPCASPPHSSPAPPPQAMAQLRELLGALSGDVERLEEENRQLREAIQPTQPGQSHTAGHTAAANGGAHGVQGSQFQAAAHTTAGASQQGVHGMGVSGAVGKAQTHAQVPGSNTDGAGTGTQHAHAKQSLPQALQLLLSDPAGRSRLHAAMVAAEAEEKDAAVRESNAVRQSGGGMELASGAGVPQNVMGRQGERVQQGVLTQAGGEGNAVAGQRGVSGGSIVQAEQEVTAAAAEAAAEARELLDQLRTDNAELRGQLQATVDRIQTTGSRQRRRTPLVDLPMSVDRSPSARARDSGGVAKTLQPLLNDQGQTPPAGSRLLHLSSGSPFGSVTSSQAQTPAPRQSGQENELPASLSRLSLSQMVQADSQDSPSCVESLSNQLSSSSGSDSLLAGTRKPRTSAEVTLLQESYRSARDKLKEQEALRDELVKAGALDGQQLKEKCAGAEAELAAKVTELARHKADLEHASMLIEEARASQAQLTSQLHAAMGELRFARSVYSRQNQQEPNQDEEQAAFNALAIAAASQASSDEQGHSGPSLLEGRPRGSEEQTRSYNQLSESSPKKASSTSPMKGGSNNADVVGSALDARMEAMEAALRASNISEGALAESMRRIVGAQSTDAWQVQLALAAEAQAADRRREQIASRLPDPTHQPQQQPHQQEHKDERSSQQLAQAQQEQQLRQLLQKQQNLQQQLQTQQDQQQQQHSTPQSLSQRLAQHLARQALLTGSRSSSVAASPFPVTPSASSNAASAAKPHTPSYWSSTPPSEGATSDGSPLEQSQQPSESTDREDLSSSRSTPVEMDGARRSRGATSNSSVSSGSGAKRKNSSLHHYSGGERSAEEWQSADGGDRAAGQRAGSDSHSLSSVQNVVGGGPLRDTGSVGGASSRRSVTPRAEQLQSQDRVGSSKGSSSVHSGQGYGFSGSTGLGGSVGGSSGTEERRGAMEHHMPSPPVMPGWERQPDGVIRFVGLESVRRPPPPTPLGSVVYYSGVANRPDLESLSQRIAGMNDALSEFSSLDS